MSGSLVFPSIVVPLKEQPNRSRSPAGACSASSGLVHCGVIWRPVVFDIRRRFRWGARAEFHRLKTVPFVQPACGMVLLMCVKFQPIRRKALGEGDQTRSPAITPLAGINKHPVDV